MPVADALQTIDDLANSPAFEDTFEHTRAPFSGREISVPLTVAFGNCDRILPKWSRSRTGLPSHTRWIEKPGWGHVPMWVDPVGVSQLILEGLPQAHCASADLVRTVTPRRGSVVQSDVALRYPRPARPAVSDQR